MAMCVNSLSSPLVVQWERLATAALTGDQGIVVAYDGPILCPGSYSVKNFTFVRVSPPSSVSDSTNVGTMHPVLRCHDSQWLPIGSPCANACHFLLVKFGLRGILSFAGVGSLFDCHVPHIIGVGANKEVLGIHTGGVVAVVADVHPGWNVPKMVSP